MSTPAPPPAQAPQRKRSRWPRRVVWTFLVLLVLFFAALFGTSFWFRSVGGARLRNACAAVERADPNWRWDALLSQRRVIPPDRNSATVVATIAASLPERWPPAIPAPQDADPFAATSPEVALWQLIHQVQPQNQRLDPASVERLKNALEQVAEAVANARRLADLPAGRFRVTGTSADYFRLTDSASRVRRVAELLGLDAARRAEEGDVVAALASARAAVNTARSIGDEPSMMAQLARFGATAVALRAAERALAQGEATEPALAALQAAIAGEVRQPLMLYALRGERAISFDMLEALKGGDLRGFLTTDSSSLHVAAAESWLGQFEIWLKRGWFEENQGRLLEELTRLIELQERPLGERAAVLAELDERMKQELGSDDFFAQRYRGMFLYMFMPAVIKVSGSHLRMQAELGCLSAALAAERYRHKHGRWPESLAVLVPEFLAEVPVDPFAVGALKLRRLPDGIVVYSVSHDGKDNQGTFKRERPSAHGTDVGVRFWDPQARRKPPAEVDTKP